MSNTALITILSGTASAKQIENEFTIKAGPQSRGGMQRESVIRPFR